MLSWLAVDAASGEVLLSHEPDIVLRTASVAKVLVLSALARAIESGEVPPDELLSRSVTARVADLGLWHRMDADALPVGDVALLVGAVSDNWATNVLVERLGLPAVNALGLEHTALHDVVRDEVGGRPEPAHGDESPSLATLPSAAEKRVEGRTALRAPGRAIGHARTMRPEIRERVTLLDSMVTAEVTASVPDRRAWMMIEPGDGDSVVLVEVESADEVYPDTFLAPEDLVELRRTTFGSIDLAVAHLTAQGVDTDTFEAPWDTDNPF